MRVRGKEAGVDSNYVLRGVGLGDRKIEKLLLKNVSYSFALRTICDLTNTKYQIDEFAITITEAK